MDFLAPILSDIQTLAVPSLFNIYFAFASIPVGFLFAIGMALGKNSKNPVIAHLSAGYIYAFRGSPLFIQLFMFYSIMLALNLPLWKPLGWSWLVLHPLFLGPLILTLNTTAYSAEIFYGALQAIPRGEVEAARAFGMTRYQQFRTVVWPNMIRLAWPAYTNEVVFLFHATALIYFTLPVIDEQKDLMNKAGELFERDYNVFLHFSVAALYYLTISLVIFFVFGQIYKYLMRHMDSGQPRRLRFKPNYLR
ncbi:ABC transporter permease subunit [Cucumibacter marinus]|uniref:ABC transporter permease subunit n=1 Tax=Cucumibacter marinus TaxID=1121252 RepID=UPI0003FC5128|nr:ABC transporter permease subunit [Cucumibacter marinus]